MKKNRKDVFAIKIPNLLSILSYNKPGGEVKGINDLQAQYVQQYGPGDYVPPVWLMYWSFRAMVGAGILMIVLALYGLYLALRGRLDKRRWFLWALVGAAILPYLANATGWVMTEVGRQPWIVTGLLKTSQAVSPNVSTASVLISLLVFALLYTGLAAADVYLMLRYAKVPQAKPGTPLSGTEQGDAALVNAY